MKKGEGNLSMMSKPIFIRKWILCRLLPTIGVLILSLLVLKSSMYKMDESIINYTEKGNVDYKVYLKDNTYYSDEYLGKGMQYIANLINKVNVNYDYNFIADENLEYKYKYKIKTNLIITDPADNNKILYNKESILKPEEEKVLNNKELSINESIDIDYQEYNSYVNSFKKEYGLSIKSKLIVTMEINNTSDSNILKDKYNQTKELLISIPLSEQTLDIDIDTSDIINSGILDKSYMYKIKKPIVLILGLVVGVIGLILLYITLYTFFTCKTKIDMYKSVIDKILRDYDRAIVSSDSIDSIKEEDYNVILVNDIDELLDAHDSTGKPILYSEIIPNELSHFEIVSDNILYKLIIDRKNLKTDTKNKDEIVQADTNIDNTQNNSEDINNPPQIQDIKENIEPQEIQNIEEVSETPEIQNIEPIQEISDDK